MKYESLIFDIDGTLWDSRELVAEGFNIQLRKEGFDHLCVDAEILRPLFGKSITEFANAMLPSIPVPERYELMERCMKTEQEYLFANECRIGYPKVKETMVELAKKHRIFIVSNAQCGYPELCIDKLGLGEYVQGHMCFGDTGASKDVTIRMLMEKHNVTDAIYIGDTQGDLEACRKAGLPFIFCAYGFGQAESYDAKIDRFEDLITL